MEAHKQQRTHTKHYKQYEHSNVAITAAKAMAKKAAQAPGGKKVIKPICASLLL